MKKFIKNKIIFSKIYFFAFFAILSFQPIYSYAASNETSGGGNYGNVITLNNPLGDRINNLPSFIYMILDIVFQIGAVLAVLALVYVGFLFVKAKGDAEELITARRAFLWTVIGIAVLLGGKLIASVIGTTVSQVSVGIY